MKSFLGVVSIALVCLACQKETPGTDTAATDTTTTTPAATGVQYVPINPSVYVPQATIDGWINGTPINSAAISEHMWSLWGGLTADSGETLNGTPLPVWETWYDSTEVYASGTGSGSQPGANASVVAATQPRVRKAGPKRQFHLPHQFAKHGVLKTAGTSSDVTTLSFNRFNQEFRDHVWKNQYYNAQVLTTLNNSWPAGTPLQNRTIVTFPDPAMMLKPVFVLASGTQAGAVPYWNGSGTNATTNPENPTSDTWKQCVLGDPTGQATNSQPLVCNQGNAGETTMPAGSYQVVPISANPAQSAFYAIKLTQDEVDEINSLAVIDKQTDAQGNPIAWQAGDFALLVASHVSSREIDNWTWQTFWWSPSPSTLPSQPPNAMSAPPSIAKPWNQYVACSAYYMVTPPTDPNGAPLYCFNPYLETGLTGLFNEPKTATTTGVHSNCMSCHRAAAWNASDYADAFLLDPADAKWFTGFTKTDFAWSIPVVAHDAPFVPPPGE